ncbi:MAG: hypothetical protein K0R15_875 [Clostridiales bacterium]|jgi:hypothetical protein|nr:hypothetical protein [Clostridiales bacterium]
MHLEKQVNFLSKKIVLFIVEGITDEISLSLVLSKIIEGDKIVKFKVINGDITTKTGSNPSNILNKITKIISEFIARDVYEKKDILQVVHLVDTDGAFINDNSIVQKDIKFTDYDTQYIFTKNVENIRNRNEQKAGNLNKLIETDTVYTNLPYRTYFFSTNLEHVLHNNQEVIDHEKSEYSQMFENKFVKNPYSFIDFFNNPEFAVSGDYNETWNFIQQGTNSLNRYSNFHLYLNTIERK